MHNPRAGVLVVPALVFYLTQISFAQIPTSITLGAAPGQSIFGQSVTLTATVTPAAATGKVTFYDSATVLGTATLSGGQTSFTTALQTFGTRSVRAYYGGDLVYGPSSKTIAQSVNTVTSNSFQAA